MGQKWKGGWLESGNRRGRFIERRGRRERVLRRRTEGRCIEEEDRGKVY